jgi:hypothetical protein
VSTACGLQLQGVGVDIHPSCIVQEAVPEDTPRSTCAVGDLHSWESVAVAAKECRREADLVEAPLGSPAMRQKPGNTEVEEPL